MARILILDIENYDGKYKIQSDGKVYSLKRDRYLTPYSNEDGYLGVKLSYKSYGTFHSLHRLLAKHFIPNPNNFETVNHIDKNKLNNSLDNLEWMTREDNVIHGLRVEFSIVSPDGEVFHVVNQNEFCRNKGLQQPNLNKVLKGIRPHHKGWTAYNG